MDLHHWDIQGAFCTSDVDTEILMQQPTGYPLPDGQCLKLCKSLYGLLQSSALFYENLELWMTNYDISKKYTLSDSGKLSFYLCVAIDHDKEKGVATLSQESCINTLLERFSMGDAHPVPTPSEPGTRLLKSMCPVVPNPEEKLKYQQLIGGLMYTSVLTRQDISFAVNQCALFMSNPGPEHIAAAKRILRYLKGTK
eukprot:2579739-Rhodomonas_salina.1